MSVNVIGNIAYDKIYKLNRLPSEGETILAENKKIHLGGKGLNQAIVASRCGANVHFFSAIGNEDDKISLHNYLKKNRINYTLIEKGEYSDESIIFSAKKGENTVVSTNLSARGINPKDVKSYLNKIDKKSYILLQGNLSKKTNKYIIEKAYSQNIKIVMNLAPIKHKYKDIWDKVDYLIVNEEESKLLTGLDSPHDSSNYLIQNSIDNVIITLGEKGALINTRSGVFKHIPTPSVSVKDTTGAGDTFVGVFTVGLSLYSSIIKACEWAIRAASITVSREGTSQAFPQANELKKIKP